MKILFTMPKDEITDTFVNEKVIKAMEKVAEVEWNSAQEQFSPEELREKLAGIDVVITGWGCPKLDAYVLEKADKLKIIAHTGGSVGCLVGDHAYEKGIKVLSGNMIYAQSVAEGALAYMLTALRNIPHYNNEMHSGGWQEIGFLSEGLFKQKVGLVSFGMIARYLVDLLKIFDTEIYVYSESLTQKEAESYGVIKTDIDTIFSECKIISIHSAQTPQTYHMIDRKLLSKIKEGAIFINTARGSVVDEEALADELETKRFKAVLDVYETEPLPRQSRLRKLSNATLIPHMGGPTIDRRPYVTLCLIEDIVRFQNDLPLKYEIDHNYAKRMTI